MSFNIPKLLKLKDNHPTMAKFNKLCEYADELGIGIEWSGQTVIVHDSNRDSNLPPIFLKDIEDGSWVSCFPPTTEFKLIYDNPEYLAQKEREQKEYLENLAEKKRLAEEQARIAKEQAELRRLKELEESERFLLASLKLKYENTSVG